MHVFYQNVNRIRSKLQDLYLNILNTNYDLICLCETNLDSSIHSSELIDDRYITFRRDRETSSSSKQSGGGLLIAVKKEFVVQRRQDLESSSEDLWLTLTSNNNSNYTLNLCLVYLPPDLKTECLKTWYNKCSENIINISNSSSNTLLLGDFNLPQVEWVRDHTSSFKMTHTPCPDTKSELIINLLALGNLAQCNYVTNSNNRILDLVLTDCTWLYLSECPALSRIDRHHPAIEFTLQFTSVPLLPKTKKVPNFNKCNYKECTDALLSTDWYSLLNNDDVNDDVTVFYNILNEIIGVNAPLRKLGDHRYPLWFSECLKCCVEEKNKVHKKYKKYKNPRDYDEFQLLRARSKQLIKECYDSFVNSVETSIPKTTKPFFTFVKSKRSSHSIPESMTLHGTTAKGGQAVCDLFATYFASVFEDDSEPLGDGFKDTVTSNSTLSHIHVSEEAICKKITNLNVNKGAGPDGIPPGFIKECRKALLLPLFIIFNKSLRTGIYPSIWKNAFIVPIYKSGDANDCGNYRPISILNCFAKLFESVVFDHLYSHVKPYIATEQHGFVRGKSTVTNLVEYTGYIHDAFNDRCQVDAVYTDFKKAFDKVNHRILCQKLECYGVHGSFLRWVESYVLNRTQVVALKGYLSAPVSVKSGIPQGSLTGPLYFVIFINDLVRLLKNPCLLYADDLKIFARVRCHEDCNSLQQDLNTLLSWCDKNKMQLSIPKCFVITFSLNHNQILQNYHLHGTTLERRASAADLGVIVDNKLSFRQHCASIVQKSNKLLGFICRVTKQFKNYQSVIILYKALVLSRLEYACIVWSPIYKVHIDLIESIQKRFLRILCARFGLRWKLFSYKERCDYFKIDTIETRRRLYDAVFIYKVMNGLVSTNALAEIKLNAPRRPSRYPRPFHVPTRRTNVSANSTIARACQAYNKLCQNENVPDIYHVSLLIFKRKILEILNS